MGHYASLLLRMIREHGLVNRPGPFAMIERLCMTGELDEGLAEYYWYSLQDWLEAFLRRPIYLPRAPTAEEMLPSGPPDLILGQLEEQPGVPVGVFARGACHALVTGTTGYGKTVVMRRYIHAVNQFNEQSSHPISLIVRDTQGSSYSDLAVGENWVRYDVHAGPLIGLNAPEGVPANIWINHLSAIICARTGLRYAWVTLANLLRWLVAEMNPQPQGPLLWPDLHLVKEVARAVPPLAFAEKREYLQSLIQVLEGITQGSGDMLRTFGGLDLERDVISQGKSVVISMVNVCPDWLRQICFDILLSAVHLGRLHRYHRVDRAEVLFFIDEADADLSAEAARAFPAGFQPEGRAAREGRECGIGIIAATESLHGVDPRILRAISTLAVFRMRHSACLYAAARSLQLSPRAAQLISQLDPGECIVRVAHWPKAVLSKIDYVAPCRVPPTRCDIYPAVPSRSLNDMPELQEAIRRLQGASRKADKRRERQQHDVLSEDAQRLLALAAKHPYWPVARLYDLMSPLSRDSKQRIRAQLIDLRYANIETVQQGSKEQDLIELTEKGWALLGDPPIKLRGRGSLAHRVFAGWAKLLEERDGNTAHLEWRVPGAEHHAVDVAADCGGEIHVYEIVVTCTENLASHLVAIFNSQSPVVTATIVAPTKMAAQGDTQDDRKGAGTGGISRSRLLRASQDL
jgi:hypothetical protein